MNRSSWVFILLQAYVSTALSSARRAGHQAQQEAEPLTAKDQNTIPRILHQSWKDRSLQPRQAVWRASWTDLNPGWATILWTDQANRHLVSEHYPWLLEVFDSLKGIHQADMVSNRTD